MYAFAVVSFRLMGIWLLLGAAQMMTSYLSILLRSSLSNFERLFAVPMVMSAASFLFGTILLVLSRPLARLLLGDQHQSGFANLGQREMIRVGTLLIGVFVLAGALPDVARILVLSMRPPADWSLEPEIARVLFSIAIGAMLMLLARRSDRLAEKLGVSLSADMPKT